ncbi:MAG: diaminopimelate epimerase [Sandaracinaceae bacterium]|nr:diaminopimelate epimerase [Sandaracinaceae bacterium]
MGPRVTLRFEKYEGLGNDFVVVGAPIDRSLAARICDRHLGVGADGVLIVGRAPRSMRVINADGSEPEMCGNGIRCVALHLLRSGDLSVNEASDIDTAAGPHRVRVLEGGSLEERQVEVWMRAPSLAPEAIGLASPRAWRDEAIEVAGRTIHVTAVSMGNPHAVVFEDVPDAIGPALEGDPRFRDRVNAGLATLRDGGIDLRVYERGVGCTRACGTGACAAAVAAVETGRLPRCRAIEVRLPGGALGVVVGEPGERVRMTGPARHVFSGSIER